MHPVSLFPQLLDYSFLAIFILRASIGLVLIRCAYKGFFKNRESDISLYNKLGLRPGKTFFWIITNLKLIAGICLLVGFYTQGAALLGFILSFVAIIIKWRRPELLPENTIEFFILVAVVLAVLMFFGPGPFGFDLPL